MVAEEEVAVDMVMVAEEEEEEVGNWSNLPYHMVELIMNKLMTPAEISDYIRCGAVCTSWQTVFIHHHHHPPPGTPSVTLPPFLIVPTPSSSSTSSSSTTKNKKKKKKTVRHNYSNKKKNKRKKKKNKKKRRRVMTKTKSLGFYNIIDKKVYDQFQVTIPSNRYFRGSSHGWLVAVDQNYNNCQVLLFNPFLSYSSSSSGIINNANNNHHHKGEILLPSLKHLSILFDDDAEHNSPSSYAYLKKAVLSADPLSNPIDYIVMAILGSPGRLAYCRPGDCQNKAWTLVEFEYNKEWGFRDVMYYKGKFVALYYPGTVVVLDPTRNMMAVTLEIPLPRSRLLPQDTVYLVESAGALLQVYRELEVGDWNIVTDKEPYSTTRFRVFKLWDETKKMNYDIAKVNQEHHQEQKEGEYGGGLKWMFLKHIGGLTLFLGDNHSIWIHAYPGFKPNSIYFTDDYLPTYYYTPWNGPHDLGIFNLVDGTIENHYPTDHNTPIWPVPIWIQPIVLAGTDLYPSDRKKKAIEDRQLK